MAHSFQAIDIDNILYIAHTYFYCVLLTDISYHTALYYNIILLNVLIKINNILLTFIIYCLGYLRLFYTFNNMSIVQL